ncbi:MAG: site-2 protease family protein [Coriobacteriaceae bacterium]|nr:site-2 protease family protein [Coriobacteriaceae bacterium]
MDFSYLADIVLMVVYATILLGVLVLIHEAGHFFTARAFGVRVTEFMLGLPGPRIGFTFKGTRFGVTAVPLGGYAKVCGMEAGKMSPYLEPVLEMVYRRGTVNMEEVAAYLGISHDDALAALDELVEWGSIAGPERRDKFNTYRAPAVKGVCALGEGRPIDDVHALYESEYRQQYRNLPFWKRSVILLAGIIVNLLFAMLLFVVIYSLIGFDMQDPQTGAIMHVTVDPLRAIGAGFNYIGMVIMAVASLFNPMTAAETVSNSTSVMGIAVMSKVAAEQGLVTFLGFMSMISVSLGIMNLIPIPPLDGGRFIVEVFQKLSRKVVSTRAMNYLSLAGLALFIGLFVVMINQDIQRFIFGNWG